MQLTGNFQQQIELGLVARGKAQHVDHIHQVAPGLVDLCLRCRRIPCNLVCLFQCCVVAFLDLLDQVGIFLALLQIFCNRNGLAQSQFVNHCEYEAQLHILVRHFIVVEITRRIVEFFRLSIDGYTCNLSAVHGRHKAQFQLGAREDILLIFAQQVCNLIALTVHRQVDFAAIIQDRQAVFGGNVRFKLCIRSDVLVHDHGIGIFCCEFHFFAINQRAAHMIPFVRGKGKGDCCSDGYGLARNDFATVC